MQETDPTVYSPYPRRLESLTICWCNYKGSTFSSVILKPSVMVWPESNSRPPTSQLNVQSTEPLVRGLMQTNSAVSWSLSQLPYRHQVHYQIMMQKLCSLLFLIHLVFTLPNCNSLFGGTENGVLSRKLRINSLCMILLQSCILQVIPQCGHVPREIAVQQCKLDIW